MAPYVPEDLEEAVRMTLRQASDLGTWDVDWWDYTPKGWKQKVRHAPQSLLVKVQCDLYANDRLKYEEQQDHERLIAYALDAMRDPAVGDRIAQMLETKWPDSDIVAKILRRYEKERAA
jgi:hypothetical protein